MNDDTPTQAELRQLLMSVGASDCEESAQRHIGSMLEMMGMIQLAVIVARNAMLAAGESPVNADGGARLAVLALSKVLNGGTALGVAYQIADLLAKVVSETSGEAQPAPVTNGLVQ